MVARWRAVGESKFCVRYIEGVCYTVVGNVNIESMSKCWSMGRAAIDGTASIRGLPSCLI